jgi:hypothetical protein
MGFPYGMEFRNWGTGGLIPRFENGGGTWSALEPSEIGSFRSFSGNKIPPEKMLARNRNGLVNETRRRDDLSTSNDYEKLNIDLSFLDSIGAPSFVGGMIKSAVDAIIGSGWGLINGSIDLIGSFGANIGNYLTNISALGGMFGGGDASREQWSLGEIAVLGIGMASLVSSFLGMAEGRSVWGEDVGDWLEVLSFGNYKKTKGSLADITWAWIPAFLSLAPVLGKDSLLQYDDQYGKGSIWDWLSVTSDNFIRSLIRMRDKGGEDLSELGDDKLLGLLALYGAYEGAVNIFDLGLPSLFGSSRSNTSKPFSFFSNDSSSKSSIPAIPSFLSRGNTSSRYTSYKGFAKGGSVQSGGMAIGPSHQGGMIGFSPDGGPFLFEGGEYIFSKESVASIGKSNLDRMNFGKGGSIANEMFNISGRSANSDQIVLIADNVSIGSINSNKMDSYFDNKYMNDLLTGNFDTGYTSFGAGGGLRSFASGQAIGPSHQSGMLGMTSSGAPFLFEGGEYIINKDAVDSIGMDNLDLINQGILPMMFGSGGSLKSFKTAGPVKGSWMDTWGRELPKTPDYFDSSFAEDMDIFMTARSRSQRKRSSNFLLEFMKPKKPTRFRDIFDPIFASLSLMSILGLGFPTKDGDSDFTKIEKGNYGDISPINQIMLLSLLGYGGYRGYQWSKSGKPVFGDGGEIPSFGIGDYLGWLWPGNWLPDGPKKGKVYHPFLATPYKGISGSSWLPWNWFDDDVKGPDTSTLARRDWYEALVYYGNIFNWFGKGGSIPEAGNGMGLFGFGTASIGAMSILADAGMLPGNAFFGSPLGSRQNKGSAGSQALTAAQAISWALGSIGLFSSMQGGERSGEMGLLSLLLMGLGSTGFKSGGKSYLNPATWAGTQKYNRSKFGSGGSIPSFEFGGKSNSGMRRFGDSPGLDLLSSLLMMGLFNELYQGQVKKGSGKNSTSSILQLIGLLGVGLSGYGTFKSLTSGNWMVDGMSGSLPYLLKDKPAFGSGGSIPSYGVGDWLFGEDTPRRKPNPGLDLLTSLILMSGSNQLYKEQVSKGSGKNNHSRLLQLLGLLGTGYFAYDSFKNLTSGNWMFGGKSGSLGYLSPKFGKGGEIPSLGLGNSPGLSLFGSLIGLALSNQIYREQVSKGSKKNNNSRLLQLLGLLGTGYFTYDSFKRPNFWQLDVWWKEWVSWLLVERQGHFWIWRRYS